MAAVRPIPGRSFAKRLGGAFLVAGLLMLASASIAAGTDGTSPDACPIEDPYCAFEVPPSQAPPSTAPDPDATFLPQPTASPAPSCTVSTSPDDTCAPDPAASPDASPVEPAPTQPPAQEPTPHPSASPEPSPDADVIVEPSLVPVPVPEPSPTADDGEDDADAAPTDTSPEPSETDLPTPSPSPVASVEPWSPADAGARDAATTSASVLAYGTASTGWTSSAGRTVASVAPAPLPSPTASVAAPAVPETLAHGSQPLVSLDVALTEHLSTGAVPFAIAAGRLKPAVALAIEFGNAGSGWAGTIVFNVWLRRQLRERKMSQRMLAAISGVDHSTVSRLLRSDRAPTLATATKLARALGKADGDADAADYFYRMPDGSILPTRRVELALRSDDELDDSDVRDIMDAYLVARARRRNGRVSARAGPHPADGAESA